MEKEKDKNQPEIVGSIDGVPRDGEDRFERDKNQEETAFQAFQKKKTFRKKALKVSGFVFVGIMIITAVGAAYFRNKNTEQGNVARPQMQVEVPQDKDVFVNDVSGAQEETAIISEDVNKAEVTGVSENYRIRDIAVGGGNVVLAATTEGLALKVSDVHSETLMSKDGKRTQLLLSWKTNKLAKSEVKYAKDGNGMERSIKEDGYGFSHALILNSLEQSTRYLFTVSAVDRSGNAAKSNALAVYTGAKPVSVFDLISAQMGDIFGWAIR